MKTDVPANGNEFVNSKGSNEHHSKEKLVESTSFIINVLDQTAKY